MRERRLRGGNEQGEQEEEEEEEEEEKEEEEEEESCRSAVHEALYSQMSNDHQYKINFKAAP